ncbi:hypothetical protein Hanom_Chr08g00748321 [Helianthus anomalus]
MNCLTVGNVIERCKAAIMISRVNPQFRRLGKLERAHALFMIIKRFHYYVSMFWVKCLFLYNIVSSHTFKQLVYGF